MADETNILREEPVESRNFIHAFIDEDIAPGGQFGAHSALSFSYRVCI